MVSFGLHTRTRKLNWTEGTLAIVTASSPSTEALIGHGHCCLDARTILDGSQPIREEKQEGQDCRRICRCFMSRTTNATCRPSPLRIHPKADAMSFRDPNTSSDASQGFYSSSFYVSNLLSYFKDRARTQSSDRSKPFFAYLPFAAPHWPLQCPSSDRDKYVGQYDDGPDELRIRRLDGLKKSGIVSPEVRPHDVVAKTKEWDAMTDEERKLSARSMEVYAGMVDRIDQEIGAVLKYLDESGEMDNTVIMFFSDNGAEGAAVGKSGSIRRQTSHDAYADHRRAEARPTLGPSIMDSLRKYYDNSYNNLGNYNSFIWYGPRWAQAATAPHRMFKGWTTEGGIRVPCVIRYPPFTEGRYKRGDIVKSFATCMDLLPTFLELSGAKHPNPSPETPRSKAPFRGRLVYPMRGKSWVPLLCHGKSASDDHNDTSALIYGPMHSIGWEINEKASLRRGSWKIVNNPPSEITQRVGWELYNLSKDLGETTDVSAQHPQILKELLMEWDRYVEETGTIYGPPMRHGSHYLLPDDMVGGDVTEDIRAWMKVGKGKRLGEITEHRPDVDEWRGQWIDRRDPEAGPAPPILPDRV